GRAAAGTERFRLSSWSKPRRSERGRAWVWTIPAAFRAATGRRWRCDGSLRADAPPEKTRGGHWGKDPPMTTPHSSDRPAARRDRGGRPRRWLVVCGLRAAG